MRPGTCRIPAEARRRQARRSARTPVPDYGAVMTSPARLVTALSAAGCLAPEDEAAQLLAAAARLGRPVDELLDRRTHGEPLPWITGGIRFAGIELAMTPGGLRAAAPHRVAGTERRRAGLPARRRR